MLELLKVVRMPKLHQPPGLTSIIYDLRLLAKSSLRRGPQRYRDRRVASPQPLLASGSIFVSSLLTALVRKANAPLAFTIMDIANRLTTGGATIACRVTDRGHRQFIAAWPVTEEGEKTSGCVTTPA